MTGSEQLEVALAAALGHLGGSVTIEGLHRLTGGASRDTWAFTASVDGEARRLVLQRQRAGGIRTGVGMVGEARLVAAAGATGVPVPDVVATGDGADDGIEGAWAVTTHVEGETIPRRILRSLDEEARHRLTRQCAEAAAAVHRIDPADVPGLHADDQVDQFRSIIDGYDEPSPAFELALRWLEAHRPDEVPDAVVHGDFRLGNLLVGDEGLHGVIDWELAHLGDPVEDLGWLCVRAWRFGGAAPVGGFGRREELHAAYEAAAGRPVDPARAHWWEVLSTLKWGVMCIIQARTHLDGLNRSVELAAIGRRVCENEYDLLALIEPEAVDRAVSSPSSDPVAPGLHGRPTVAELLDAVGGFLSEDVAGETDGRVRYHARVAANVLGIVERELALGPGQAAAHASRLADLGAADDRALASAIRSGSMAPARQDVVDAIATSVVAKLDVAHPGYAQGSPR